MVIVVEVVVVFVPVAVVLLTVVVVAVDVDVEVDVLVVVVVMQASQRTGHSRRRRWPKLSLSQNNCGTVHLSRLSATPLHVRTVVVVPVVVVAVEVEVVGSQSALAWYHAPASPRAGFTNF